jgi:hypothetical protein
MENVHTNKQSAVKKREKSVSLVIEKHCSGTGSDKNTPTSNGNLYEE